MSSNFFTNLITWDEYKNSVISDRKKFLTKENRLFHVLFSQQFDRPILDDLYQITNKIRIISKTKEGSIWLKNLLMTKRVMLYFVQASTRTFLSFGSAAQMLGMSIMDVRSLETSSEVKGESFTDTIITFSSYFDMVIMRHPQEGHAEEAAFVLGKSRRPVPVINAGSGKDQHPTQALLDIFTLRRSFEKINGLNRKTIMFVGDLKRGRTVRSLCYLLSHFDQIKIIFCAPKPFQMREDILLFLKEKNIEYKLTQDFNSWIAEADAVYMTRIQDEHDKETESLHYKLEDYTFKKEHLEKIKASTVIMHPLPRRNEIDPAVDHDPRAVYWKQVRNGMWTRSALMAYIFKLENKILNY